MVLQYAEVFDLVAFLDLRSLEAFRVQWVLKFQVCPANTTVTCLASSGVMCITTQREPTTGFIS